MTAAASSCRGILFSAPMILALRDGRKSQTRRLVDMDKLRVHLHSRVISEPSLAMVPGAFRQANAGIFRAIMNDGGAVSALLGDGKDPKEKLGLRPGEFDFRCPYAVGETWLGGESGEKNRRWTIRPRAGSSTLWVRETWRTETRDHAMSITDGIRFAADDMFVPTADGGEDPRWTETHHGGKYGEKWRNPLFLPQWASRFTLDVLRVRLERLQDITTADILAEGIQIPVTSDGCPPGMVAPLIRFGPGKFSPAHYFPPKDMRPDGFTEDDFFRAEWAAGWNNINGRRTVHGKPAIWENSPWVWAITFHAKRIA